MAVTIQLKDFTAKTSPVPADIMYLGDSANSYDEVQSTIAEVIGAYPALVSIGSLTTTANEIIYTTDSNTYATAPITAFGLSVLALSAGVTTPTAGDFATWDANANLSAKNLLAGFQAIPSAGATTTLTVASPKTTQITGSANQTVQMPVVSTLVQGQPYTIINSSTGTVTVNSSGGNLIQTLAAGTAVELSCILTSGTSAASWYSIYLNPADLSGAVLLSPTGNQIISSNNLSLATGSYFATLGTYSSGSAAGGVAGEYIAYSTTASMGSIALLAANNSGNYANIITNTSTSAARTWTFPDVSGSIGIGNGGTWTPTVAFATPGDLSVSYANQLGYYYQIGKMVILNMYLNFTVTYTTATGNLNILGIPITPANSSGEQFIGNILVSNGGGLTLPANTLTLNTSISNSTPTIINVSALSSPGVINLIAQSNIASGTNLLFIATLTYISP